MDRQALLKKLELVSRALAVNNLIPVFTNFVFTGKTVYAYNDHIGIVATQEFPGVAGLEGSILLGALKASESQEVEFEMGPNDVSLRAGKASFTLPFTPEENFLFTEPHEEHIFSCALDDELRTGLECCLTTVGRDQAMPALMGICLHFGGKIPALYSCDSDAMTKWLTIKQSPKTEKKALLLPTEFCEAILKIWHDIQPEIGTFAMNEGWAWAQLSDATTQYTIYGRMPAEESPLDYEGLLTKTVKDAPEFVGVPVGLAKALSRARVLADRESAPTVLRVQKGRLSIETRTSMGDVNETLPLRGGHPDVKEAKVHASLLQRSIAICDEFAIFENCIVLRKGDALLQLTSNMS